MPETKEPGKQEITVEELAPDRKPAPGRPAVGEVLARAVKVKEPRRRKDIPLWTRKPVFDRAGNEFMALPVDVQELLDSGTYTQTPEQEEAWKRRLLDNAKTEDDVERARQLIEYGRHLGPAEARSLAQEEIATRRRQAGGKAPKLRAGIYAAVVEVLRREPGLKAPAVWERIPSQDGYECAAPMQAAGFEVYRGAVMTKKGELVEHVHQTNGPVPDSWIGLRGFLRYVTRVKKELRSK